MLNEEHELNSSGGCKSSGFPPDPLYPSDPRSDYNAFTPVYRGGQNQWFAIIDAYPNHGPNASSGLNLGDPPIWHEWDNSTIFPAYSLDSLTALEKEQYRKDWFLWLFPGYPNDFIIRGLKQLYDLEKPFKNEALPTVSEFELWNHKVLNHFRFLSGLPLASMSRELFIMCKWSQERKTTTLWDSKYPGIFDSAYGPCVGGSGTNIHCGTTFKPDYDDQKPYWNDYNYRYPCMLPHDMITLNQGSEALTVWYNGNAMTAMSRNLRKIFEHVYTTGGPISGHSGTFARRELVGLAVGRSKWAGSLFNPPDMYSF